MKKTSKPENYLNILTFKGLSAFILVSVFLILPSVVLGSGKSNKNSNEKRLAHQLENTAKLQQRYQARLNVADSLIAVGDTLMARTTEEIRQATDVMREHQKTYTAKRKELEKSLNEVSREEASQMRLAIRDLDAEYRDALRAYDDLMRRAIRESESGTISYARGREYRREAEKGLREAERQMARLRESTTEKSVSDDVASK
ncbi:hypothetical protein [Alkaliflexus imshenetskii]|jgi:exonuclease III|uniref:hypothetical protein n=1 Tax=Alkaliflexus imshenetskii TaxID=286730 RepID=UPI00047BB078|nr:hypothetical protein [Alkaliflexus imshenetskii]